MKALLRSTASAAVLALLSLPVTAKAFPGALTFGAGGALLGALDLLHVTASVTPGVSLDESFDAEGGRTSLEVAFPALLTPDVQPWQWADGSGAVTLVAGVLKGVSSGGTVTLSDWFMDVPSGELRVDVVGLSNNAQSVNQQDMVFATLTTGSGGDGQHYPLTLTTAGQKALIDAWGVTPLGTGEFPLDRTGDFGTLTVSAVPEPGTVALTVVGLAAVGLSRRRRSKG